METIASRCERGRVAQKTLEIINRDNGKIERWISNVTTAIYELGEVSIAELRHDAVFLVPRYLYGSRGRHYPTLRSAFTSLLTHLRHCRYLQVDDTKVVAIENASHSSRSGWTALRTWAIKHDTFTITAARRQFDGVLGSKTIQVYCRHLARCSNGLYKTLDNPPLKRPRTSRNKSNTLDTQP